MTIHVEPTPQSRSDKIADILENNYFCGRDENVIDILADIMHYCHQRNIAIDECFETAYNHFYEEVFGV